MRKMKAIAIAAPRENPLLLAAQSAKNFVNLVLDFMYGTPQRTQLTLAFALALAMVGGFMASGNGLPLAVCLP